VQRRRDGFGDSSPKRKKVRSAVQKGRNNDVADVFFPGWEEEPSSPSLKKREGDCRHRRLTLCSWLKRNPRVRTGRKKTLEGTKRVKKKNGPLSKGEGEKEKPHAHKHGFILRTYGLSQGR